MKYGRQSDSYQAQRDRAGGMQDRTHTPVRRRRWLRRTIAALAALVALLVMSSLVVAYVWQPPEVKGYSSRYLARVDDRYANTSIARFHYLKTGYGPPVVLVPGGTLWLYSYRNIIPALERDFTVYAVDMPGQGYTEVLRQNIVYDLPTMSEALGAFMDAVGVMHASVVGHSWGGAIALYFAEHHPDRVDRLGLIDSPGLDDPSVISFRLLEVPVLGEVIGKLLSRAMYEDGLRREFVHQDKLTEQDVDEYWAPTSQRENRAALWMEQRGFDYSVTDRGLGDVVAPTASAVGCGGSNR
jgi:pimeloyl-ACP methyl ester carboxylesterase